jgi:transposase
MRRGRRSTQVEISEAAREELLRWTRRSTTAQALALRARIILACVGRDDDTAIAKEMGLNRATVGKWRRRFLKRGVDGLLDEPRPGAPRTISDAAVERVLVRTLETKPRDATQWS